MEITQKLGFEASTAITTLTALTTKLNAGTEALARFQRQGGKSGPLKRTQKGLDKTKKKAQQLTLSWTTMARVVQTQIALRALNGVITALTEGITKAHELGLAIEEIQTISSRRQTSGALSSDIIALSDALGKSSSDLAEANYQVLSNQVVDVGEALNFTSQAAKLATITASDTKDAVNALSSVMNSYGFEASKAEHIAGTLFKTVELGRLRLSEIANVIGRVTPLTAAMGVEWEEAAAAIAVMTRQGVRADTAITQLRAVMTKIIKPTDEMREIFRSWGVEDGKQAIETFGGLNGVLAKLAEETGGSSAEMADLLRRVRAIVGQLSIMTNEGEDVVDTMEKIKNAGSELNEQWDKFTASDAHRLTVEMNKFDNTLTRIGTTTLPYLDFWLEGINKHIEPIILGWELVAAGLTEVAYQEKLVGVVAQRVAKQINADNKWFAERQRLRYEGLAEAANRYYAEAGKREFSLANIREKAFERANRQVQRQGKDIFSFYSNATKSLEDFISKVGDKLKSNTEKIADIERGLESRRRDTFLEGNLGNAEKRLYLVQELARQEQKLAKARSQISISPESRDRAIVEAEVALEIAKQGFELAKQSKNLQSIATWDGKIVALQRQKQGIYRQNSKAIKDAVPEAKRLTDNFKAGEKELAELVRQRNELYESKALVSRNEARRRKAEEELASYNLRIDEILREGANADAFLGSLGLDQSFAVLTAGLTEALNQSHIDWEREIERGQEEFNKRRLLIRLALDPTGVLTEARRTLGLEQGEVETESAFARRGGEAAESLQKRQSELVFEQGKAQDKLNGFLAGTDRLQKKLASYLEHTIEKGQKTLRTERLTYEQQLKISRTLQRRRELLTSITDLLEKFRRGETITSEELARFQEVAKLNEDLQQLYPALGDTTSALVKAIEAAVAPAQRLAFIQKQLATPEELKASQVITDEYIRRNNEARKGVDIQKQIDDAIQEGTNRVINLDEAAKMTDAEFNKWIESLEATKNKTSQIGPTAASQVGGVNSLAQAFGRLADNAERVVIAQSRMGGAGAVAYHGGRMSRYFANGGFVGRGQDKIMAALSKGETVIDAKNSRRFYSQLNAMNQGAQPVFREQGGPVTNVGDINVTVNGGDSSPQTVREIGHGLRREIRRGTIRLT